MNNYSDKFYYDETSPSCLRWKIGRYTGEFYKTKIVSEGDAVGSIFKDVVSNGSVRCRYRTKHNGKMVFVHTVVWELHHGSYDKSQLVVDHIDGDTLNNTISNLRLVTTKINARNKRKSSKNTSGTVGVHWVEKTKDNLYAVAHWTDLNGQQKSKSYQVKRYGLLESFCLAKLARENAIKILNMNGAGYTERHQYGI